MHCFRYRDSIIECRHSLSSSSDKTVFDTYCTSHNYRFVAHSSRILCWEMPESTQRYNRNVTLTTSTNNSHHLESLKVVLDHCSIRTELLIKLYLLCVRFPENLFPQRSYYAKHFYSSSISFPTQDFPFILLNIY